MSFLKNVIGGIVVFAILAGCAATPITDKQVAVQVAMEQAEIACYNQQIDHDIAMMEALGNIPKDQIAFVVMMMEMSETNKEAMAMATGKSYNPCNSGTSVFDVQVAELKEKNQVVADTTNSVLSIGKWIVGGWAVSTIIDKATGDAYSYMAKDNGEINVGSQNTGSYNTASGQDSSVANINEGTTYNNNEQNKIDSENDSCATGECEGETPEIGMCTGERGSLPLFDNGQEGDWVSSECSCSSWQDYSCDV